MSPALQIYQIKVRLLGISPMVWRHGFGSGFDNPTQIALADPGLARRRIVAGRMPTLNGGMR
ncbi:hypothetical protein, partial [Martelella alba]|uniref:hypothetical protein n=1 Tax=Martelella alba TaxID=2590451 RepID=UPI001AEE49E2